MDVIRVSGIEDGQNLVRAATYGSRCNEVFASRDKEIKLHWEEQHRRLKTPQRPGNRSVTVAALRANPSVINMRGVGEWVKVDRKYPNIGTVTGLSRH